MTKTVALYMRVSSGEQTIAMQEHDLAEGCERHGWQIVARFTDEGISGAKGRDKRPAFDKLHRAMVRRECDIVAAWSVDRLGRSLQDLIGFLGELNGAGLDLYLHRQGLDTSTPAGRALFGMLGVFAEFERAMIVDRVRAGMARAKASGKHLGRPALPQDKVEAVRADLAAGMGVRAAARHHRLGLGTVHRLKPSAAA